MYQDENLKRLYRTDNINKYMIADFRLIGQKEPFLTVYDGSRFIDMSMDESLSSGTNLEFGSCEATQIKLTVLGLSNKGVKGTEMTLYQTMDGIYPKADLYPSEDTFPAGYIMPFGKYVVLSAEQQANTDFWDVTALDFMFKFGTDVSAWYNALSFPISLRDFRASLCRHVGVTENVPEYLPNDDILIDKTVDAGELIGRQVLIACEQANGVFGHFDRNGVLQHVALQPNDCLVPAQDLYPSDDVFPMFPGEMNGQVYDEQLDPYLLISCEFEEYTVKSIDKVQIRQEEGDIGALYGDGTNVYTVEGNFLLYGKTAAELEQIAKGIYGLVSGRMYVPYESESKGLPYIEVGDALRFNFGQEAIVSYVLKRTLKGIYALRDSYGAEGEEIRGIETDINKEIIQLQGKATFIKKNVDEVSARLVDLGKNTEAQFKITAEEIAAEVKRANEAEAALRVQAGKIETSVTNLSNSTKSQFQQMADEMSLKVSGENLISEINLKLTQTGSVITMNAGHFEFKGQNFFVNLDGSGGAANGNFTWDKDGKIKIKGAEISGALIASTQSGSTMSCNVFGCVSADIDRGSIDQLNYGEAWGGDIHADDIYGNVNPFSDGRLKRNVEGISPESAEQILRGLRPVSFEYINGRSAMGFIAQEVEELCRQKGIELPLFGRYEGERALEGGTYVIPYLHYIPLMVSAIQKIMEEMEDLKCTI